jgi:excisionase family DNA binding protein
MVGVNRETLSIMKACDRVGVCRRTIYNWITAGKVEYTRTAGGSIRIFADSLWRQPTPDALKAKGESGLEELVGVETPR